MAETLTNQDPIPEHPGSRTVDALQDGAAVDMKALFRAPRWRHLQGEEITREDEELQRTAREQGMDYAVLLDAFHHAELESLSDADWDTMENTDSIGQWTKAEVIANIGTNRDHAKIFRGIENGENIPAPIVMFREGRPPYLIAGNTRLMACKALGLRPVVLTMRV